MLQLRKKHAHPGGEAEDGEDVPFAEMEEVEECGGEG